MKSRSALPSLRLPAVLAFIGLLTACALSAQTEKPSSPELAQNKPDYSQEPFVLEQYHHRVRFENDGTGWRELAVRIRVQSDAGVQQLGQLAFGYSAENERLEITSVQVQKLDGTRVSAPPEAVQDMTAPVARDAPVYTDYRQKHVTVPGLRPGETLVYRITTHLTKPLAPGHFWLQHDFLKDAIVLDELLEVSVPRDRAIQLKTRPGSDPITSEENGRRIYRWKNSNLKREEEVAGSKKKRAKPEDPAVQLTTFQGWAEVGRWYAPLQRERSVMTSAVRAKAEELTRDRKTDLEKLEALYDFVAKNFRYVSLSFGLGRYQPHSASDVLANQYGDCKDKHTLLAALAKAVGINAYPALINSSRKIDVQVPSPAQFDHVITVVPFGQDSIWLDTTTEVAPFRLLSSNLRGKQALVIAAAATDVSPGNEARLMETPANPPFPAWQRVEITGQVSELGKLTARVRYTLRGDNELLLRLAFRRTPQHQWKQLGQLLAFSDGFRGEVNEVKAGDPAATREPFEVEYSIAQANYLDWSAKKSQLALPLPAVGLPDVGSESDTQSEPIELGTPLEVNTRVELELPAKYSARAPVPVGVSRDYADYRSSYRLEGNRVIAERTLRFRLRQLPAARSPDYLAFARAVRTDESQMLSVESAATSAPAIPATAKADELHEAGVAALQAGNFSAAAELLERVVAMEPKHKRAWNDLGRAYLSQLKWDRAIESLRRQIAANPYDAEAYFLLGLGLTQQQKYDEAAEALRKQLELNPLDPQARAALGTVYLQQRKYAEAAPELEKAVTLVPNNASLQVSLGQAYLNLGQGDRALAAFDKAVELAPSTMIWNNVAYQLALSNIHLDRAQQYAESAVSATAAELRNATLDGVTVNTLQRVGGLAAYWDTLGWVYHQKGDADRAERYIRASWLLSQHGEVGDHLAQILEKRGRKREALRTYAQALAASRPVPETWGRLERLAGGKQKIEPLVTRAPEDLTAMRTVKLGKLLKETASAEFLVLLAARPNNASGQDAVVEDVKFISGSENVRPLVDALRRARYPVEFPDSTPTKLIRRGILSCSATTGECVFVLMNPDSVTSVD